MTVGDLAESLNIAVYADGADIVGIRKMMQNPLIAGFTTNPTLMRKAGIEHYKPFALDVLDVIDGKSISFEVFSDDFDGMQRQAEAIAQWGSNVFVKIPVTNSKGESSAPLIENLARNGVQLNVTAILAPAQIEEVADALSADTAAIVSVFAGRIADTGVDPIPVMTNAKNILKDKPKAQLLWASPREVLNLFQADQCGCDIITMTHDQIGKLSGIGKDLSQFSRETVQMFYDDACAAGYTIDLEETEGTLTS